MISNIPDRVRARPTLRDVMDEIVRVHECIHGVSEKQDEQGETLVTVQLDLAHMKGVQETITQRMGVPNAPPQQIEDEGGKPIKKALILGSMSPFQAVLAVLGSLTGIAVFYQIMAAVIPALHRALMAVQ